MEQGLRKSEDTEEATLLNDLPGDLDRNRQRASARLGNGSFGFFDALKSLRQTTLFGMRNAAAEENKIAPSGRIIFSYSVQFLCLFALMVLIGPRAFNDDWSTYGINLLARLGDFPHFYVAQSAITFHTPQIFSDYFVILFLKAGMSLQAVLLMIYFASSIALVFVIMGISRIVSVRHQFPISLSLILFVLSSREFLIGGAYFWDRAVVHSIVALVACLFALYYLFGSRQSYVLSYLMCGLACLIQIQIGFYFGGFILIYHFIDCMVDKKLKNLYSILFWAIPMVSVSVFCMYGAEKILTNEEFVEIYGRLRHPHHMIPSSWGWKPFLRYFLLCAGACGISFCMKNKRLFYWMLCIAAISWISLFINFIFTDYIPLRLVVAVQPVRTCTLFLLCAFIPFAFFVKCCMDFMLSTRFFNSKNISYLYFAAAVFLILFACSKWTVKREKYLRFGLDRDLQAIADYLNKNSSETDCFLVDPYDSQLNLLGLLSKRSPEISWKIVPIHDPAIIEWVNRLAMYGYVRAGADGRYRRTDTMSLNERIKLAGMRGVRYFVTSASTPDHLPADGIEFMMRRGKIAVYRIIRSNGY